jgi:hypothetical protein
MGRPEQQSKPEDLPDTSLFIHSFRVKSMECKSPEGRLYFYFFYFLEAVS